MSILQESIFYVEGIMWRISGGVLAALLVSACSANSNAVFRDYLIEREGNKSVVVDAKERAILSTRGSDGTLVCAEPSPDALSALGQSLTGSGAFRPTTKEAALALSFAMAESAGQLKRSQSIQALRDGLYRACEGYLNGALTKAQYRRVINKYADATVVLVAIEQITPQSAGSAVTLTTNASTKEGSISNNPVPPGGIGSGGTGNPSASIATPSTSGETSGKTGDVSDKTRSSSGTLGGTSAGGQASGGLGNALPPPDPHAVSTVQYIVSYFLSDMLAAHCLDSFDHTGDHKEKDPETVSRFNVPDKQSAIYGFCEKIISAALQRGTTGREFQLTPPPAVLPGIEGR